MLFGVMFASGAGSVNAATTTKYAHIETTKLYNAKSHLRLHGKTIYKYKITKSKIGKKHHKKIVYRYKIASKSLKQTWGKKTIIARKRVVLTTKKGRRATLYYIKKVGGYVLAKDLKMGPYVAPTVTPPVMPPDNPVNDPITIAKNTAMATISNAPIKTMAQLKSQMEKMKTEGFTFDEGQLEKLDVKFLGVNLIQLEKLAKQEPLAQRFIANGGVIMVNSPSGVSAFANSGVVAETDYSYSLDDSDKVINIKLSPTGFSSKNVKTEMGDIAFSCKNYSWFNFSDGTKLYTTFNSNVDANKLPVYAITHEFGHTLQGIYGKQSGDFDWSKAINFMRDKYMSATGKTGIDYYAGISAYGYTSSGDGFAEAYASYRLGPRTPQNMYVPEEINNWLKIAYGG